MTAILMCPPDHFGVEYEINPWMHVQVQVDRALACEQWEALQRAYEEQGVDLRYAQPQPGLPDLVFTANAAVVWNRTAVLSSFHHAQRQGEEPHWRSTLERLGFTVRTLPREISFEGAGDALFVGDLLVLAHGFRTDAAAHEQVAAMLGVEHVSVELVDPRFYHLDTCFCPLDDRTALCAVEAFSPESVRMIRERVPRLIEVPVDVAAGFACNAIALGDMVVSSTAICGIRDRLAQAGYGTVGLPMTEFMKSGGGVRCLSLPLDVGANPIAAAEQEV